MSNGKAPKKNGSSKTRAKKATPATTAELNYVETPIIRYKQLRSTTSSRGVAIKGKSTTSAIWSHVAGGVTIKKARKATKRSRVSRGRRLKNRLSGLYERLTGINWYYLIRKYVARITLLAVGFVGLITILAPLSLEVKVTFTIIALILLVESVWDN